MTYAQEQAFKMCKWLDLYGTNTWCGGCICYVNKVCVGRNK